MSSMTIDQLKKSLTEQGITLPPSRSKKADYVKLYKQYTTINDSLGDVYSSDDENPPRTGSQSVTSSSSPSKGDSIAMEVEQLSDDDLYHKLKEFDPNIGPVLKNTRRVYEKKLIKILSSGGKQTNGYETVKTHQESYSAPVDEFSDSDVETISKSSKRSESKGRKSSVLRDSPKPSSSEASKPEIEKSFTSNYEFSNRSSTPGYSNEIKPSRYSYIERVPKGSSYSYIEPDSGVGFNSDLRQRFTDRYDSDKFSTDRFSTDRFSTDKFSSDRFGADKYSTKSGLDDVYKPSIGFGDQYKSNVGSQFKSGLGGADQYKPGFASSSQYKPGLGLSNQYKSGGGFDDHYLGTWEPNIKRYMATGSQKATSAAKGYNFSSWIRTFLAALLLLALVILVFYIYHQWAATDPYKMIEDDAERTIQALSEGSGDS